jgi:hypothetical protein
VSSGCGGGRTTVLVTGFFFVGLAAAVAAEVPAKRSAAIASRIIDSVRLDMSLSPQALAPSHAGVACCATLSEV